MRGTVKALDGGQSGDWVLDVLGAPIGSPQQKDGQGEWYTPNTKYHEDKYGLPPVVYYHGLKDRSPVYYGKAVSFEDRQDGRWYRVVLDKTKEISRRVWEAAQKGMAAVSPGSARHLVRVLRTGEIEEWPILELSIWDWNGSPQMAPASKRAVAIPVLKSVYQQAGIALPDTIEDYQDDDTEIPHEADGQAGDKADAVVIETDNAPLDEERSMEPEVNNEVIKAFVSEEVQAALKADREEREAKQKADQDMEAAIKARLEEERTKWEAEAAKSRRLPFNAEDMPYKAEFGNVWKFDNADDTELALGISVLDSAYRNGRSRRGVSEDAYKALAIRYAESERGKHHEAKFEMIKAGMPLKANELNQSTLATYGDEWVGAGLSNNLWMDVSLEATVASQIPTIIVPQGVESITIPIEGTHPSMYVVAQASAQTSNLGRPTGTVTSSKMGTGQRSLTVGKLGASTLWTGELEEDSMTNWVAELRRQMVYEMAVTMDDVVINGDTETAASTNINDIAGTAAGTEPFMLLNGFRKLTLVTNTANSRSGGALDENDYLETLKLMGLAGRNALDPRKVSFIQDLWTGWKAMDLDVVKTKDTFSNPTIEKGALASIWGYPVITSPWMHRANTNATYGLKANSAGKLDLDTAANNIYGAILAVRWDQWRLGMKRRLTIETTRYANSDANEIVAMMRFGLNYRDTDAAAITYGIEL